MDGLKNNKIPRCKWSLNIGIEVVVIKYIKDSEFMKSKPY